MSGEPWRFRCPDCDSSQIVRLTDVDHPAAQSSKRYRCKWCGARFDRRVDARTGEMVA